MKKIHSSLYLDFGKKDEEQAKNKTGLAVPQNIRKKCLDEPL